MFASYPFVCMGGAVLDDIPFCLVNARCPICGRPNACRLESGEAYKGACWCEAPQISDAAMRRMRDTLPEGRCLCFDCLSAIAADEGIPWSVLAARSKAALPVPGEGDSYVENGCVVFTAKYHLRRGYCCGSACRHCPYP